MLKMDSVRYERDKQQLEIRQSSESPPNSATSAESIISGTGNILCTHDGVLLKKASAEHIADLNTSGALSLVEYTPPRRLFIEWRPNESILVADDTQDQGDWALVDTIKRRTRTTSECKAFNTKPIENNGVAGSKARVIRTSLEALSKVEVKHRGQSIRFMRKSDGGVHSEYFFQHGNADLFVRSMRQLHIIDFVQSNRHCEEYAILTNDTQKLKRTFAELDIGEIKARSLGNESWLSNRFSELFINLPEYVAIQRNAHKVRPGAYDARERQKSCSSDTYQMVESRSSSSEKSPTDSELDNHKICNLPERPIVVRGSQLNEAQWLEFRTPEGRISDPTRVKEIIFHGGIAENLRCEVWKYMLNYFQWNDTDIERIQHRKEKSMEYYSMKAQWLSMSLMQENNFAGYRERKCQIEKDVKRTDRTLKFFAGEDNPNLLILQGILMTYVMYNFDLGYVQGMSDLLAPILAIEENEVDAFWCFVGFMDMVFSNFDLDQAAMNIQFQQLRRLLEFANPRLFNHIVSNDAGNMYFCFRWLLVWFKREFSNEDILKLWECLWTRLPCPNFQLFISLAILEEHTENIIANQYDFSGILKHVNDLSGQIDVKCTLETAEAIYLQIKDSEELPNDIRQIIGEPLLDAQDGTPLEQNSRESDDEFDELVPEPSPEQRKRQQEQLEEACERSMFLQFM